MPAALGVRLASTFLMRNAWIIAFGLLAVVASLGASAAKGRGTGDRSPTGAPTSPPRPRLLLALAVTASFHSRSIVQYEVLCQGSRVTYKFNMCQVCAFGRSRRCRRTSGGLPPILGDDASQRMEVAITPESLYSLMALAVWLVQVGSAEPASRTAIPRR